MSEWQEVYLTDVFDIGSGLSKPASEFGSGFPFLSFKEIFNNFFIPKELSELVESSQQERDKFSVQKGDVFLTRTSETVKELGMSCVALKDYEDATFGAADWHGDAAAVSVVGSGSRDREPSTAPVRALPNPSS